MLESSRWRDVQGAECGLGTQQASSVLCLMVPQEQQERSQSTEFEQALSTAGYVPPPPESSWGKDRRCKVGVSVGREAGEVLGLSAAPYGPRTVGAGLAPPFQLFKP